MGFRYKYMYVCWSILRKAYNLEVTACMIFLGKWHLWPETWLRVSTCGAGIVRNLSTTTTDFHLGKLAIAAGFVVLMQPIYKARLEHWKTEWWWSDRRFSNSTGRLLVFF